MLHVGECDLGVFPRISSESFARLFSWIGCRNEFRRIGLASRGLPSTNSAPATPSVTPPLGCGCTGSESEIEYAAGAVAPLASGGLAGCISGAVGRLTRKKADHTKKADPRQSERDQITSHGAIAMDPTRNWACKTYRRCCHTARMIEDCPDRWLPCGLQMLPRLLTTQLIKSLGGFSFQVFSFFSRPAMELDRGP
jgi:hypothetical protein